MIETTSFIRTIGQTAYTVRLPYNYIAQSSSYYYGGGDYNIDPAYSGDINGNKSSGLINTGSVIWLTVVIASLLIIGATLIRIAKRKDSSSDQSQDTQ